MRRLLFLLFLLLRTAGMMLLRRRACAAPLLALALACLGYQSLMLGRNRAGTGPGPGPGPPRAPDRELVDAGRLVSDLEVHLAQRPPRRRRAVVLTGRHPPSDTEVRLYQRVLQTLDYEVHMSRYAETSSLLRTRPGGSGWSLLLCLSSSERSCLRRIGASRLQQQQMVNLRPELMEAFSDAGGGVCRFYARSGLTESDFPMMPHACGSTNQRPLFPQDRRSSFQAPPPALVAMVNVYVLVTSVTPLTSFLHDVGMVTTNQQPRGRPAKVQDFLLQQLGPKSSHHALGQVRRAVGRVLQAASSNQQQDGVGRCVLCFQLLTFTLLLNGSSTPVVVQVDTDVTFSALSEDAFDRQITRDLVLEDTLRLLLSSETHPSSETHLSSDPPASSETHPSSETHLSSETHMSSETHASPETNLSSETWTEQGGGCRRTGGVCLSRDDFLLLLHFHQQLKTPSGFQLLHPGVSSSPSPPPDPTPLSRLLLAVARYHRRRTSSRTDDPLTNQQAAFPQNKGGCSDPRLRQIYTHPPLVLTPPFSPGVKEYRAEVAFDIVMVRIRPEPVSAACRVHLDEHRGPRMANYPVGLGNSRISILVTDASEPAPVVMTIYTVHVFRESRPSLPMFGEHVTCSFVQDCGLLVQPGLSCGLQPHIPPQSPVQACSSGDVPGRWVVPCLSCSDNRTCDWREVAWHPDGCYHPVVDPPLLQDCMTDRKVLFIGDSTNRGMMYFLMERVNSSLEDWGKNHDTLVYQNLNRGRTQVSYSYYPQFWLEKDRRPTFRDALLQLLARSGPLQDSDLTVLVVGGVQWLHQTHLRTIREVLDRASLSNVLVLVKSLGLGFHLQVDGVRSLSLPEIQNLFRENGNIVRTAKHLGYEVIDTFSITMGRHKEFLQGRCACHFHEVEKLRYVRPSEDTRSTTNRTRTAPVGPGPRSQTTVLDQDRYRYQDQDQDRYQDQDRDRDRDQDREAGSDPPSFHVRGPVNQVYSEILLSRLCPRTRTGTRS